MFRRFYVPKVLCSEQKSKVLYSEGSIFRRFYVPKFQIVHPIESAWDVGTKTNVVDGHMHTGLNPFYRATHVFPEWHHNYVGSIILCGCVENKLGVNTEYLVSLWCNIIIFHTVQGTFSASRAGLFASFQLISTP